MGAGIDRLGMAFARREVGIHTLGWALIVQQKRAPAPPRVRVFVRSGAFCMFLGALQDISKSGELRYSVTEHPCYSAKNRFFRKSVREKLAPRAAAVGLGWPREKIIGTPSGRAGRAFILRCGAICAFLGAFRKFLS